MKTIFVLAFFVLGQTSAAGATTHLVLIGGGLHPKPAMDRLIAWAGGRDARLLVVAWATSAPHVATEDLIAELGHYHPAQIEGAPAAEEMTTKKAEFLRQLGAASGVFFSGGDQNRVMDVLRDREILAALRRRFADGVVFGGTSAGTAIMSRTMITGNGVFDDIGAKKIETREGLGLLEGVIVDQHFLERQRENRLFSALLRGGETRGLGIDEGTAVAVEDGRRAEVLGPKQAMLFERIGERKFTVELLAPGAHFPLAK